MLRIAEQYSRTDTGRQRKANEDALLARAPLFVVADGMGGAKAGEVASRVAIESFDGAPPVEDTNAEVYLSARIHEANARIHELSRRNADQAGMGTTLTAVHVGSEEVTLAHVGDSRAYCMRDGELVRLTEDHSLVDELIRQGRLTPAEAQEHPQRSVITRALGPEPTVEVDTYTHPARAGDLYLLCSDGLTTMLSEQQLAELLSRHRDLREAGEALVEAANRAGGRDNITVILVRLEEAGSPARGGGDPDPGSDAAGGAHSANGMQQTAVFSAPASAAAERPRPAEQRASRGTLTPRRAHPASAAPRPAGRARRRWRAARVTLALLAVLAIVAAGAYLAAQSVYFIGTNGRGLLTIYSGLPYELPAGLKLYSRYYVSGVPAAALPEARRRRLLDNSWRSEGDAGGLLRSVELEQLAAP